MEKRLYPGKRTFEMIGTSPVSKVYIFNICLYQFCFSSQILILAHMTMPVGAERDDWEVNWERVGEVQRAGELKVV